jgi:hypothetical protein
MYHIWCLTCFERPFLYLQGRKVMEGKGTGQRNIYIVLARGWEVRGLIPLAGDPNHVTPELTVTRRTASPPIFIIFAAGILFPVGHLERRQDATSL